MTRTQSKRAAHQAALFCFRLFPAPSAQHPDKADKVSLTAAACNSPHHEWQVRTRRHGRHHTRAREQLRDGLAEYHVEEALYGFRSDALSGKLERHLFEQPEVREIGHRGQRLS